MRKIIYKTVEKIAFGVGYTAALLVYIFGGRKALYKYRTKINKDRA